MKVCIHCHTEYLDEYDECSDCKGPLIKMSESKRSMLDKLKHPVKLTGLKDMKEIELLEALLSIENIKYFVVDPENTELGEEGFREIYVEENRLERTLPILEKFQFRIEELRDFAEKKSRMIKPALLVTVGKDIRANPYELVSFLEDRHISCCCETEQDFVMGRNIALNGIMSGKNVSLSDIYVDEMYLPEARNAVEEFLEHQYDDKDDDKDDVCELTDEAELEEEELPAGSLRNWLGKFLK